MNSTLLRQMLFCLMLLVSFVMSAQCPTGNVTGNVTISSDCTIAAGTTITITGNLTLNANLVIEEGATLIVTGSLTNSYVSSSTSRTISGGGTLQVASIAVGQNNILVFNDVTVTVSGNVDTGYAGGMTLINSSMTVGGNFVNAQSAVLTLDNSDLILTGGSLTNSYGSKIIAKNDSYISVTGNIITLGSSTFTTDNSDVYVYGSMNNSYYAELNILDGSYFYIEDDFNNGMDASGNVVTTGGVTVNASTLIIGGDLNNEYGSDLNIDGGGVVGVGNDVDNAQAASINIGDGTFYYGGTLTDNPYSGGVNTEDGECTASCCGTGCSTLPVTLVDFTAKLEDGGVVELSWSTATEQDNDYFTLSKSYDGTVYTEIAKIPGQGNSKSEVSYDWEDDEYAYKQTYYQLTQTDFDGKETFLKLAVVYAEDFDISEVTMIPNPVVSGAFLKVLNVVATGDRYQVISLDGKTLGAGSVNSENEIPLNNLHSGIYVVQLDHFGYIIQTKIIVE